MLDKAPITVQSVDGAAINGWHERNEVLMVDVREPSEFETEHIPGALLLPLSSFDPEIFPTPPGKTIVLYCAIGKRSAAACKMLLKESHHDVVHLTGGIEAWKAAGFATEVQIVPPDQAAENVTSPAILCPPPGHVLQDEYLTPLGISQGDLANLIGISEDTVAALVAGMAVAGVELSLRLARYFCTAADFWIRLQIAHDLERARYEIGDGIRQQVTPRCTS